MLRVALPLLCAALLVSCASAACILPIPVDKGARLDETFQHATLSPSGFFQLFWNSSGDSALAAARVPRILAALDSARVHHEGLPGAWSVPLGPRAHYPVLVVRQSAPGATTLPFTDGGVAGLTWIQLDHDFGRWGGDADALLDVTCAHEFFHAFQFALGADLRDLAFYEASAVWAEDQVFPDHDDWAARYLPALLDGLHAPLDYSDGIREYGAGAVLKFLLAGAGSWEPCRRALLEAGGQARCWPALLAALDAPSGLELARCLGELLHAGDSAAAEWDWRVPELATAPPVERGTLAPLVAGSDVVPEGAQQVDGLCWRAMPLEGSGRLQLTSGGAEVFHLTGGVREPAAVADSTRTALAFPDWLLLVNAGSFTRGGLAALDWDESWNRFCRVWPNPGGPLRRIEFFASASSLECFNLWGQRLGTWSPPGPGPGPFLLELPPAASGPLFLREPRSGRTVAVLVLR